MAEQEQSLSQSNSEKSLLSSQLESLQAQKLESIEDPDGLQKQLLSLTYLLSFVLTAAPRKSSSPSA